MGTSRRSSRSTKSFQWGSFWALPDGAVQAQSLCKWGFRELPRASGQLPGALRSFWARPGGAVQAQSLCNCGASGPSPVDQYKHIVFANGPSSVVIFVLGHIPTPFCHRLPPQFGPLYSSKKLPASPLTSFCNTPAPDMPQLSKSEQTRQPASQPASQPAGQAASQPTPRRLNCGRDHNLT